MADYTARRMNERNGSTADTSFQMGRFLTVAEVARTLRVSNMTVYRLLNSGQIPAVRIGRGYRVLEEDMRKYIEQRYMDAG